MQYRRLGAVLPPHSLTATFEAKKRHGFSILSEKSEIPRETRKRAPASFQKQTLVSWMTMREKDKPVSDARLPIKSRPVVCPVKIVVFNDVAAASFVVIGRRVTRFRTVGRLRIRIYTNTIDVL